MRILLVTPPMTQLNTPYPATAYLTGCLRKHAADASTWRRRIRRSSCFCGCSRAMGSTRWRPSCSARRARRPRRGAPPTVEHFLAHARRYVDTVEPVVRFLQGRDPSLALRIAGRDVPARGAALRRARRRAPRGRRSARLGVRRARRRPIARATSPACSSTTWPTSCATASIPASSCRATARSSRRARPRFDPLRRRARRPADAGRRMLDELARELRRARTRPTSSA